MDIYRLFIALHLPDDVKDGIERVQHELRAGLPGNGIRWARREQLHLTLRFLGAVEPRCVEALTTALALACRGFGVLPLRARGIGVFPAFRRPRVIWVGVNDEAGRLEVLQHAVEGAAAGFTAEPPEASFKGHVTLGRCRTIVRSQAGWLAKAAPAMEERLFGDWNADAIHVVSSARGPQGSRYTTLSEVPLASDAPPD